MFSILIALLLRIQKEAATCKLEVKFLVAMAMREEPMIYTAIKCRKTALNLLERHH